MKEKRATKNWNEFLIDFKKRIGDPVAVRYRVEEYRPEHTTSGYDGSFYPDEFITASPWFDTLEEVQEFARTHEPQSGNIFKTRKQNGYDRVERVWY